jgi:hypothetical protein
MTFTELQKLALASPMANARGPDGRAQGMIAREQFERVGSWSVALSVNK